MICFTKKVVFGKEEKEEELMGRYYYVTPAVMMVEGTHTGSDGPVFFKGDGLKESVNTWDGRPVTINHPPVGFSGNDPDVLNSQGAGYLFNTRYEEEGKKLVSDVWLLKGKREYLDKEIDVSIGVQYSLNEDNEATNIIGDHLALLPFDEGACNRNKGCGLGLMKAEETEEKEEIKMSKFESVEETLLNVSDDVKVIIEDALELREAHRSQYIATIKEAGTFCSNFLDRTKTKDLKSILEMIPKEKEEKVSDYSASAAGIVEEVETNEMPSIKY